MLTVEQLNEMSRGALPELLGIVITRASQDLLEAEMVVSAKHMAPNGFLHAGTIVSLADTCCGYACRSHLPKKAVGFTTIELKSNHLGTARDGVIECRATPRHIGGTTQVWDAEVSHRESSKTIALFRCTQMVLYPR